MITSELTDRDAVQRAVHGTDAVISALGPSLDRKATGMPLVEGSALGPMPSPRYRTAPALRVYVRECARQSGERSSRL